MWDNDFLVGGLILGIMAFFTTKLKWLAYYAWAWLERRYTTMIVFDNHDPVYNWGEAWIAQHVPKMNTGHRRIASSKIEGETHSLLPKPGLYNFKYEGRRIWIYYWRKRLESVFNDAAYYESIYIWYWSKDKSLSENIIQEGRELINSRYPNKIVTYTNAYDSWHLHSVKETRSLETVSLEGTTKEDLVKDLRIFLTSKKHYQKRGLQWKRGYLFQGPPGNGKSSMVIALASEFKMPLYVLSLASVESDSNLIALFSKIPKNCISVVEDIDTGFKERELKNERLSFSTFLNLFDGVITKDGQIIIITTNHPEALDPALTRKGRADRIVNFENASKSQVAEMAMRLSNGEATEPEESLEGENMATVQDHYLSKTLYKGDE